MKQNQSESQPVSRTILANGVEMLVHDNCRRIAGDRWLVRLRCELIIPVAVAWFGRLAGLDQEELAALQQRLGERLVFELVKERHFVSEEEKSSVFTALQEQMMANVLAYLANPAFPEKLFDKRARELRGQLQVEQQLSQLPALQDGPDEDDGPPDFSACFKD